MVDLKECLPKTKDKMLLGLSRIALGWLLFWAFLDKTFGLGYATESKNAWINGGSPTYGYLKFATADTWFENLFSSMAESTFVEYLFMFGLLAIGLALMTGVTHRLAGYAGALMFLLMYLSALPLEHNPFMDDHLIYLIFSLYVANSRVGEWFGLGKWWSELDMANKIRDRHPALEYILD